MHFFLFYRKCVSSRHLKRRPSYKSAKRHDVESGSKRQKSRKSQKSPTAPEYTEINKVTKGDIQHTVPSVSDDGGSDSDSIHKHDTAKIR